MGGGGRNTTEVTVPAWLEEAARRNLSRADELARIGPTPYYGPDVAAMTPMQVAAMQGTNTAASALGLSTADPMAGMPTATNYGGMSAYSSGGLYDQALAELERRMPGQYAALRAPFIDPMTGAQPTGVYAPDYNASAAAGATSMPGAMPGMFGGRDTYSAPSAQPSRGGTGSFGLPDPMSGSISGVSRNVADAASGAFSRTPVGMAAGLLGDVMGRGAKSAPSTSTGGERGGMGGGK
jgi:hypothetical protein